MSFNIKDHKGILHVSKEMYEDLLTYHSDGEGLKILFSNFYPAPAGEYEYIKNKINERGDHYFIGYSPYFHPHFDDNEPLRIYGIRMTSNSEGYKLKVVFSGIEELKEEF